MPLSFFAKHTYFIDDPAKVGEMYLCRVSSRIRGEEIATFLKAKLNPKSGYENDVRIFVKPHNIDAISDGSYVDVLDDIYTSKRLHTRPKLKVIAMSTPHYDWLKSFLPNEIIYIPHHHLNFERARRYRREVTTCGFIGANSTYNTTPLNKAADALKKVGMKLVPLYNFKTREDSTKYLQEIDIQVIPHFEFYKDVPYYHQTKIVNALSFGIPTIAGPKLGYQDVENFYLKANNLEHLVETAVSLREHPDLYDDYVQRGLQEAEKYHIENVAKLYRQLV